VVATVALYLEISSGPGGAGRSYTDAGATVGWMVSASREEAWGVLMNSP
jgi:hypothetical protein